MGRLDEIGEADGWRCWLCDEPVDPSMSVNDDRGPSVDGRVTAARSKKKKAEVRERLAHRGCNTKKGAVTPVIDWPEHLFIADPAPIIPTVDRLARKGGREAVGRCPGRDDGEAAAEWLVDRISRLEPELAVHTTVEPGGGQFLVVLHAS